MKDLIGFVGVGQCGGNIVSLFQKEEYKTFYINTSLEDLNTIDTENYYYINGANGSSHNRNKAVQYMKNHYQVIIENILDYFQKQEIVYLVFSAGGGTGSGISPLLLDMLSINQEKVFGAVCVLPDINEPISVQLNAYNCMIQLSKIKNIGSVFVLDNSKNTKEMVNVEFFKAFNSVINIPRHIDTRGNIDISEIKELLSIRGVSAVSISEHNNDSANIIKTLEKSCFSYEQDKKVVYIALSTKEVMDVNYLVNYTGTPYDIFTNYNKENNVCCLSGMSFPTSRINIIKSIIDNQKNDITSTIENSKNNFIKNDLDWAVQLKNINNNSEDFSEIFLKYQ